MVTHNINLSDMFNIKNCLTQGDALSPLLFIFALDHAITRVQINKDGFIVNGTHHEILVYADDSILGGIVPTIKKNTEALLLLVRRLE